MGRDVKKYIELNALKGRIREEESSYRKVAKDTCIGITSLTHKLNGLQLFDTAEIERIAENLNIIPEEITKYFFPRIMRNALRK